MALSFHEKPTILIIVMLFLSVGIAIVSLSINASAEQYSIPSWIKDTAKLWGDDKIGDSNFKQGLQWLIENKIMTIPEGKAYSGSNNQQIPIWVRNDAKWWADDQIGDSDFVQGMQYLIQIRTINIPTPTVNNPTPLPDTTPPVITLLGSNPVTVQVGSTYTDAGATATDNIDGILTPSITVSNSVNTTVAGTYTVTYNVSDKAGNAATQVTRTVNVVNNTPLDTTPPVITLLGSNPVTVQVGSTYTDAGATATDNIDGILTPSITVSNSVNTTVAGTYTVTYNVKDKAGNAAQAIRTVNVVVPAPIPTPPPTSNEGSDKWGIKMLHPTITNGREWFNTWDNSHSRILTANDRDPDDSMFKVSGQSDSIVVIDGKGVATMSGTQPRMYVYDQTLALKWLNVEVTVYGERISETQLYSSQGINIGARSTHQNEVNTPCGVNTYYSRMLYSGNANFAKELNWPDDVKKPGSINGIDWNLFGNTTFPYDTWIGHKFVLRTVDSGTHVRMEMWRDLTNGLNGGDWKSILNYTDTGDMTDPITPGCPTNDLSHIILEAGPSIFIRNTDISAAQYKEFSVREIDPLP